MSILKHIITFLFWLSVATIAGIAATGAGVFLYFSPNLPGVDEFQKIELQTPLRIYSNDGKLIGEFGGVRRDPIDYDDIPKAMINAVIAIEDDEFYAHNGVDIKGLLRAAYQLISSGKIKSGGSTITMQVARGVFLSNEQKFSRKLTEILLALKIEREITKNEIITLYLNKIFLGNNAYGIKAAAQVYYGKPIEELTLAQYAMIAGLPKAPSTNNPLSNPEKALSRRNSVLNRMLEKEFITKEEHAEAINQPITARYHGQALDLNAAYVAEMARIIAFEKVFKEDESLYTGGYEIHTTIDSTLQDRAQNALANGLMEYDSRHGYRGPETSLAQQDKATWLQSLKGMQKYGPLLPAVVVSTTDQSATVMLANETKVSIDWDNGIKQARPYKDENNVGKSPSKVTDVINTGDVIRIVKKEDQWHLSQIPAISGALASIDPDTGAIIALSGGFDFSYSPLNRADQASRLPGSNFKPFIYAIGLRKGLTPATVFNDSAVVLEDPSLPEDWRPGNSDGKFTGPTRLRKALYLSKNLVSIRLLKEIGIDYAADQLPIFGVKTDDLPRNLSMVLGTHSMTPLEVARGYAVFANGGYLVEPFVVKSIVSRKGEVIYETSPKATPDAEEIPMVVYNSSIEHEPSELTERKLTLQKANQTLDSKTTFLMSSMLSDVINRGTATKARSLKREDIAGKTGTTNGPTDAWFSGFQRKVVTSVWVGFDQPADLGRREFGGTAALPIWIDYMELALKDIPQMPFNPPAGITRAKIDPDTGMRTRGNGIWEYFTSDNVPPFQTNSSTTKTGTVTNQEIF